ncbi:MAG: methyl-accepting chemotaxis protein [Deltaproteobacteria bacterium]|nr:methyl-accepting chemotaxis protein [Deltaproteobacteria bacterium]
MSRENYSYKRRQVFVKKRFQAAFILKFCLLVLLGAGISTGLLFLLSKGTLTTTFEHSRIVIRDTGISILPAVILTNLITLCIVTAATIFVVLFISHKIAGPLFRFEKELDRIAAGDLTTTIRIRKKDQMAEMAARLNLVTESLQYGMIYERWPRRPRSSRPTELYAKESTAWNKRSRLISSFRAWNRAAHGPQPPLHENLPFRTPAPGRSSGTVAYLGGEFFREGGDCLERAQDPPHHRHVSVPNGPGDPGGETPFGAGPLGPGCWRRKSMRSTSGSRRSWT